MFDVIMVRCALPPSPHPLDAKRTVFPSDVFGPGEVENSRKTAGGNSNFRQYRQNSLQRLCARKRSWASQQSHQYPCKFCLPAQIFPPRRRPRKYSITRTTTTTRTIGLRLVHAAKHSGYAAKSTFGTSRTDGGTLKKSPSDLKPKNLATRLLGKVSHLFR